MRILGIIFFFIGIFFGIFFIALWVTGDLTYGPLLIVFVCWALAFFIFKE